MGFVLDISQVQQAASSLLCQQHDSDTSGVYMVSDHHVWWFSCAKYSKCIRRWVVLRSPHDTM